MLRHYLFMAVRGVVRHRLYSTINVLGLTIGLTCVVFAILFVRDELSYDKWIPDTRDLYRLELTIRIPGRPLLPVAQVPYALPTSMQDQIPGVTGMTRLDPVTLTLTRGTRQFAQRIDVVDPNFFEIIKLPFVVGNPHTVFRQPESVVLSQSAARKYFGDADPIGRTLTTQAGHCHARGAACPLVTLRVTGIVRDLPHNTQLRGGVYIPNTSLADPLSQTDKRQWLADNVYGYVRLAPGVDPATVAADTAPIFDRYVTAGLQKAGSSMRGSQFYKASLTPFTQVHLTASRWEFNMTAPGSWTVLYGVMAIGGLILLTACINFMNLATARATLRAREVSLRKLLGASRAQLISQFLSEAVLMALLSLVLALALAEVLLPLFDQFVRRPITFGYATDPGLLLMIVGIAVGTGLLGGSYPSLILSRFRPVAGLHTHGVTSGHAGRLRNALVLIQFAVSIAMAIAASVVFRQLSFARHLDLGFHRNDVVVIANQNHLIGEREEAFAQALRAIPGVSAVGLSNFVPFNPSQIMQSVRVPGQSSVVAFNTTVIGPDYPDTYGIRLVAGRLLSADRARDLLHSIEVPGDPLNSGRNVLVNEAAARRLGFTAKTAVNQTIIFNRNDVRIVGVLANAKLEGAHELVPAMVYIYIPRYPMNFSVRLRPGSIAKTLAAIDGTWHAFVPTVAIQRWFLSESFRRLYREDERQGGMLIVFVGIAILIACLGLFGLAVFTAERRTKEVGVRKISGARTRDIVRLMLWRISSPVLIANVFAWPVAYYYLHRWLDGYAYRISLSPVYFLAAGLGALIIAWATVYVNTLRVAGLSPVHTLRYE